MDETFSFIYNRGKHDLSTIFLVAKLYQLSLKYYDLQYMFYLLSSGYKLQIKVGKYLDVYIFGARCLRLYHIYNKIKAKILNEGASTFFP